MSTLGALKVLTAEVHIPSTGAWWADVTLNSSTLPAIGATTLTIADLKLAGQVLRADFDDNPGGAKPSAVVRGGAGWRKPVARAGTYVNANGVKLLTVLTDLQAMTGEVLVMPADATLGPAYSWQAHAPSAPVHYEDLLADLMSRGAISTWRVDPATGVTRFDAWPSAGAVDGRGRVMSRRLSRNHRHVGLAESVAAFVPGATLEGAAISRVLLSESSDKRTADVYLDSTISAHQSIRRVLVSIYPWLPDFVIASGKGLAIRAAGGLLHLMGGPSDPAVVRVGDGAGYLYFQSVAGAVVAVYYSPTPPPAAAWVPLLSGAIPPTATTPGTPIKATTGSSKVTCG